MNAQRCEWIAASLARYFASPAATVPQTATFFVRMLDRDPDRPILWNIRRPSQKFYDVNNRLRQMFAAGLIANGPMVLNLKRRWASTWVRRDVAERLVVTR